jgi:hypothetical protein
VTTTIVTDIEIGSFRVAHRVFKDELHEGSPTSRLRFIQCLTCKRETYTPNNTDMDYGCVVFRPLDHDPHCPARNHVYLEGIGPMIEPRAVVFEKTEGAT